MPVTHIIGMVIIVLGLIFMAVGVYGVYTHSNFYAKATMASLIDSVGFLLVTIGIILYKGFSTFSAKTAFLFILILLLNPLANHYIVRGARTSGYMPKSDHRTRY